MHDLPWMIGKSSQFECIMNETVISRYRLHSALQLSCFPPSFVQSEESESQSFRLQRRETEISFVCSASEINFDLKRVNADMEETLRRFFLATRNELWSCGAEGIRVAENSWSIANFVINATFQPSMASFKPEKHGKACYKVFATEKYSNIHFSSKKWFLLNFVIYRSLSKHICLIWDFFSIESIAKCLKRVRWIPLKCCLRFCLRFKQTASNQFKHSLSNGAFSQKCSATIFSPGTTIYCNICTIRSLFQT